MTPAPDGGLSVRVSPRGRGYVVAGASALALGWIGRTLYALAAGQPLPLGASLPMAAGIGLLLSAAAFWCAFATEDWRVAPNCLEHRLGIGRWSHVRRYRDADLEIVGHQDKWGRVFYRLYAVAGSERHVLLARRLPELIAWADMVAARTGWTRRDAG